MIWQRLSLAWSPPATSPPPAVWAVQVRDILSAYKIGRLKGGADPGLKDMDPYKNEPADR